MNWTRLLAVIRKEFIQLRRDPTTLALLVGIPVVELLMFGYALNTVVDHLPTAIYDQSETSASRQFVAAFQNSGYFDNRLWVSSEDELRRAIDDGTVKVGLVIPPDFGDAALRKELATAQIVIDGSDPNVAQTALFAGGLIGQVQSANIVTELLNRAGSKATNGAIDLRPVVLYNPRMLSVTFMVPGLYRLCHAVPGSLADGVCGGPRARTRNVRTVARFPRQAGRTRSWQSPAQCASCLGFRCTRSLGRLDTIRREDRRIAATPCPAYGPIPSLLPRRRAIHLGNGKEPASGPTDGNVYSPARHAALCFCFHARECPPSSSTSVLPFL